MNKKEDLIQLINTEGETFKQLNYSNNIVPNSIPIIWFGNYLAYEASNVKIITVSLNPSDNEFKMKGQTEYSPNFRFPSFDGSDNSLFTSYNEYFEKNPYNSWFKSSFKAVLESFNASHYNGALNTALHTDIASPYATNPTWSGLDSKIKEHLELMGSKSWHALIKILEPDVILFSASFSYEKKIEFNQIGNWEEVDVKADRPLLSGKFQITSDKETSILFQVQGRKPFLKTNRDEKLKFNKYI